MWHLNFIIPLAVAFIGLVALTAFIFNLLCDAIVDGTVKKGNENIVEEVGAGQSVASAKAVSEASPQITQELFTVEHKALQCAGSLKI